MKKSIIIYIALLIISLSLTACGPIKDPTFERVDTFRINAFEKGILTGDAHVVLRNDNLFSFSGDSLKMHIYFNKHYVGFGNCSKTIDFNSKSSIKVPLQITMYVDSLQDELKTILYKDSINIKVQVSGKFTKLGIASTKELSTWIKLEFIKNSLISKSISESGFSVKKMSIIKFDLNQTILGINAVLTNTLPFNIKFNKMTFDIFSDDAFSKKIGYWNKDIGLEIIKGDSAVLNGEITLDTKQSAITGFTKIFTGGTTAVDYFMKGDLNVSVDNRNVVLPVVIHFTIDIISKKVIILN